MLATRSGSRGRKRRSTRGASEIAQFIPAVYILFLIVFLPLLNLGTLFVAAAVQYLATNDFVSKASTQPDYASALDTMVSEAYLFQTLGLSKFISMVPDGGYTGCGDDLYIVGTNTDTGVVTTSGANEQLNQPIDTKTHMYELSVKSIYNVSPVVDLSAVPIIGEVPGVGQPVTLTFSVNRPVEHPGGLQPVDSNNTGSGSGGDVAHFNRQTTGSDTSAIASNVTWRDPTIFQQIQAAGETVVSVNVVIVQATNAAWTPAGITLNPGQKIWIDTQAIGMWKWAAVSPGFPLTDANGSPTETASAEGTDFKDESAPVGALVGEFGTTNPFMVGNTLINYSPQNSGTFGLCMNDAQTYTDNLGAQMVRVIIVQ